jgi:hypothetical protein
MCLRRTRKHKNFIYEQHLQVVSFTRNLRNQCKIIAFEKQIKKAHSNIFCFLSINLTNHELTRL